MAIFGANLKTASIQNEKGEHLFFDPSYQSEYKQRYHDLAKKKTLNAQNQVASELPALLPNEEQMKVQEARIPQAAINESINQAPIGQESYFIGNQHTRLNSHEKRQMHLKGQWKIQDMDPHV